MSTYRPTERMCEALLDLWREGTDTWRVAAATDDALTRRDLVVREGDRVQLTASGVAALRRYWGDIAEQVLDAHHAHALTLLSASGDDAATLAEQTRAFDITDPATWDDANLPAGWQWRELGPDSGEFHLYNAQGQDVSRFYAGSGPNGSGWQIDDIETDTVLGTWDTKDALIAAYDTVISAYLAEETRAEQDSVPESSADFRPEHITYLSVGGVHSGTVRPLLTMAALDGPMTARTVRGNRDVHVSRIGLWESDRGGYSVNVSLINDPCGRPRWVRTNTLRPAV